MFALIGCSKKNEKYPDTENTPQTTSSVTQKPTDFTLPDILGNPVSLANYRGKVVLIDFWATWCPPCRRGIPDLIELQKEFEGDLVVIGISVDSDTKDNVPSFVKEAGINYPVVYGDDQVVQAYGGIEGIPTTFILDKSGAVVNSHVGLTEKSILADEISKLK
jgi:cytochrome c biogenesis protein CcmG/thiol:disulfide interchange protein DsbE